MSESLLVIESLTIGYRDANGTRIDIVHDASFTLNRGETLGIVGESGCGKSTLAFALLGYCRPGAYRLGGSVHLNGIDLFGLDGPELQRLRGNLIALVPQHAGTSLTPTMRVGQQVEESLRLYRDRGPRPETALQLFEQVRLPPPGPSPVAIRMSFPADNCNV